MLRYRLFVFNKSPFGGFRGLGFMMNDEMVCWLEENKDVEVSVVCI